MHDIVSSDPPMSLVGGEMGLCREYESFRRIQSSVILLCWIFSFWNKPRRNSMLQSHENLIPVCLEKKSCLLWDTKVRYPTHRARHSRVC
jgi:hypothetical protein